MTCTKHLGEAYKNIFLAIKNLKNNEAITILESAKLDILLNDNVVTLDVESGAVIDCSCEQCPKGGLP